MHATSRGFLLVLLMLAVGGCVGLEPLLCGGACNRGGRHNHGSSSLVGFLYPEGTDSVPADTLPNCKNSSNLKNRAPISHWYCARPP